MWSLSLVEAEEEDPSDEEPKNNISVIQGKVDQGLAVKIRCPMHSVPQKKWPKFSFSLNADYCRLNEVAHNSSYSIQGRRNQSFHRLSATGLFYKLYG